MALTAKRILNLLKTPGRYRDERGLYLQVSESGASWLLRYEFQVPAGGTTWLEQHGRRERWMGLGSLKTFSLKEARIRAREKRQLLADGIDPLAAKESARKARLLAAAKAITFEEAARQFVATNQQKWRNAKHRGQWTSTLETYAFPVLGALAVADIDTGLILKTLEQKYKDQRLWDVLPETASRLRGRMEKVLAWATTRNYRAGDNPAAWKNHLDNVLPARGDIRKVAHHPALPYADIGDFIVALRKQQGLAPLALEFAILTAARTGAVLGATRDEIDFKNKVWSVPPERAGAKIIVGDDTKPRRIPLSDRALSILETLPTEKDNPYLFGDLSDKALSSLMKEMAFPSTSKGKLAVPHGFRSTFKDWASECTAVPNFVSEAALWHAIADKVEAAYRRGDLFEKRRRLMNDWARYCGTPKRDASVIPLRRAAK